MATQKWFKKRIFDLIAALFIATAIIGLVIYAAYVRTPGPIYRFNSFLGIWFTALGAFFAVQTFYITRVYLTKALFIVGLVYSGAAFLESTFLLILFGLSGQPHGTGWSVFLMAIHIFTIVVLLRLYNRERKQDAEKRSESDEKTIKRLKPLIIINYVFAVLALIFLALLINGAMTSARGVINFQPRGKIVDVTLSTGQVQPIHFICEGPQNSSFYTFWFEVGGGHVAADFYGIQKLLTERNVRSCIYDRPGMGWSGLAYANNPFWYHEMLVASGEQGPFILAAEFVLNCLVEGWAAGGAMVINATIQHPEDVAAVVLMDVAPNTFEVDAYALTRQVSREVAEEWYRGEVASRFGLFDVIRGFGTPAGLMSAFLPYKPYDYYPPERYDEFYWFSLQESFWTTQFFAFQEEINNPHSMNEEDFPRDVPIALLISRSNTTQRCSDNNYAVNSDECSRLIVEAQFYDEQKRKYANLTDTSTIVYCNECDLGFPVRKPFFTADALIEIFSSGDFYNKLRERNTPCKY